jgi:hypothetical protein
VRFGTLGPPPSAEQAEKEQAAKEQAEKEQAAKETAQEVEQKKVECEAEGLVYDPEIEDCVSP